MGGARDFFPFHSTFSFSLKDESSIQMKSESSFWWILHCRSIDCSNDYVISSDCVIFDDDPKLEYIESPEKKISKNKIQKQRKCPDMS